MFYGVYRKPNGETCGGFFEDYEDWFKANFSPDTEILSTIDFSVHGKTYTDRKEDVREKAIDFQDLFSMGVSISWGELAEFGDFFETQGRRYGLLVEFRENGIL